MIRMACLSTLAILGLLAMDPGAAHAQIAVSGGLGAVPSSRPAASTGEVVEIQPRRRPWRERNPYYLARPVYRPEYPGARARITLEPFTSRYYPTGNSYYPPIPITPPVRVR